MTELQLFTTGGTIDKQYDELTGELTFGDGTLVPRMLEQARFNDIRVTPVMELDSLDMEDDDRDHIADACEETDATQIVITHGTDTMVETGRVLKQRKAIAHKTIVLTGAMIPYSFGVTSDALANLGSAIAFAQVSPSGAYIAMNGRRFDVDNVRKNKVIGEFEAIN